MARLLIAHQPQLELTLAVMRDRDRDRPCNANDRQCMQQSCAEAVYYRVLFSHHHCCTSDRQLHDRCEFGDPDRGGLSNYAQARLCSPMRLPWLLQDHGRQEALRPD
jgi:hypothetical protein